MKKIIVRKLLTIWTGLTLSAVGAGKAAELANVPMQGMMNHITIHYNAAPEALTVHLPTIVPQLTPLDVSHPGDGFAPADPWFASLDPSQAGLAFNRQYGFVMDGASDFLPVGTGIRIRLVSRTPGLQAYLFRGSTPKAWEPILGTDDSTNVLEWSLTMFHPAFAAPPGNGTHAVTLEADLANLATGEAMPGVAARFTLEWTVVPRARPTLSIAQHVVIAWPMNAADYLLQWTESMESPNWSAVTNTPVVIDGRNAVVLEQSVPQRFYRLTHEP